MTILHRAVVSLLMIAAASGAQAARTLPLDSGTYIQGGADMVCADAANAGTLYFDGKNLQGPHLSSCKTTIKQVARDGKTFATVSDCDEQDKDGNAIKDKAARTLHITDRTHFEELTAGAAAQAFHRCGSYPAH